MISPDQLLTPPVFNYSRSLQWACTAEIMFQIFKAASDQAKDRLPVNSGNHWVESDDFKHIHPDNRCGSPDQISAYFARLPRCSHWGPEVFERMAFASCVSLALQWGTVGGAFLIEWFTPTTGMGCRSLTYLIYGAASTVIWMMLLISSILAHYYETYSDRVPLSSYVPPSARVPLSAHIPLSAHVALALSHCLRKMGKLLAIVNSIWVFVTCILQYSDIYDTCFCNSSMISRGAAAYVTITETSAQAALASNAWIGALFLACISAITFVLLVGILIDTLSAEPSL